MIRVVVVDDDRMAASVHRAYVERIHDFAVVGEAHTGAEALELVRRHRPELVLLDIYLPDMSGLDVLHRLRELETTSPDVIAITSAKDVETLRRSMQGGVIQYLVKPFFFDTFKERLERYASLRARLSKMHEASQSDVDRLYSILRTHSGQRLPKGISAPTLAAVIAVVRREGREITAVDVAEGAGISRGTARRYLDFLVGTGSVELTLRYGAKGRPEHLYRWSSELPVPQ